MRCRDVTRRLVHLAIAAFVLGAVAAPGVAAQSDGGDAPDVDQFGGFVSSARSNAVQITYDSPNLLPTGSPVVQLSMPEALANLSSGPQGYALASFLFPGPLVADLGAALAAGGQDYGIPPYPVRAEAFYPGGPTEASEGEAGTEMVAVTSLGNTRALGAYAGLSLDPVAHLGGAASRSQSAVVTHEVVSRTRTELSNVSIAGGLVHIDSIVTDLVSTSNGETSATSGGTRVSGVTVLGLPATIDENGIRFVEAPDSGPDEGDENPVGGVVGGLVGGITEPVSEQLDGLVGPLNDLLDELGGAGEDVLQQLFEASGIEIRTLGASETVDGATATRSANGLSITLNYDGDNTPLLTDLLALVPSAALPSENLGPIPFSPQALALMLERIHTISIVLAPGNVSTSATPAFEFEAPQFTPPPSSTGTTGTTGTTTTPTAGDFETASPQLPAPAEADTVSPVPVSSDDVFPFGLAVPLLAVLGVILSSPFLAAGSSRLADNTLAVAGAACPEGLDRPPTEESPP